MKKEMGEGSTKDSDSPPPDITSTYVENRVFLQKFLTRFLPIRQDAEDAAQEAFLRAYTAEQKKHIEQPKAYMFRVAKNVALTKLRKKSAQIIFYIEDCAEEAIIEAEAALENPENELEAKQTLAISIEAIEALSGKCREAVFLRKVKGLSHKEIAEKMSLSISSVEKYLCKGFLEFQEYIEKKECPVIENEQLNSRSDGKNTEYLTKPK